MKSNNYEILVHYIEKERTQIIYKNFPAIHDIVDIVNRKIYNDSLHEFYEWVIMNRIMMEPRDDNEYEDIIKLIFVKLCGKKESEFVWGG
jgi:hypothetical protein